MIKVGVTKIGIGPRIWQTRVVGRACPIKHKAICTRVQRENLQRVEYSARNDLPL